MDLSKFKARNPSQIFIYRNLRAFEKILFLEHNVKELIALLKRKNNFIKELQEQLDRVIESYEESKQVKALKAEITNNLRVISNYKKKLQKDPRYSEEEAFEIAKFAFNAGRRRQVNAVPSDFTLEKWFEQFKKK